MDGTGNIRGLGVTNSPFPPKDGLFSSLRLERSNTPEKTKEASKTQAKTRYRGFQKPNRPRKVQSLKEESDRAPSGVSIIRTYHLNSGAKRSRAPCGT